ncbi:MAG TPA: phage major capsid protein, partial [Vulgatibacter sp.]
MLRQKIAEARKQRAKLIHDARAISDKAEAEKRELSAEEQAQWDAIMADVDSLKQRVDRLEQLADAEADGGSEGEGEANSGRGRIVPPGQQEGRGSEDRTGRRSPEYREAFYRAIRGEASQDDLRALVTEARAQGITTPGKGGYVVPDEFERTLVQKLEDENVMRRLATVLTTVSGDRQIPVESDTGSAAWLDEASPYTEADVTFAQATL